jgi:hypothetical protein
MPVRMRLTGQLGRRGDEASWHRSSRRAAVAGGEMAFTREEENGMGVVRSAHDQVEEEEGGPAWHPAATADRQRPGHAATGMAALNRGGGALPCGPHGIVPVGQVKRRSIDLKIN